MRRALTCAVIALALREAAARGAVIESARLFGGSGEDSAVALAVDASGAVFLAGSTSSPDLPGASTGGSLGQAFVTKLSPTGEVVFTKLLGGSGLDRAAAIALDGAGSVYVAGYTTSPDFPVRGALQPTLRGAVNAFVAKLNASDGSLVYSTYLGGEAFDAASSIAVDSAGRAVVAGSTTSRSFPTKFLAPTPPSGGTDAFVAVFAADGSALVFSRLLGGTGDDAASAVAVDAGGRILVAGITSSLDFPASIGEGVFVYGGGSSDGFVAELDAQGRASATLFGGDGKDTVYRLIPDGKGGTWIAGSTSSTDLPVVNPAQANLRGTSDAFVARVVRDTSKLPVRWKVLACTYLGGQGEDVATGLALDASGALHVAGFTQSVDFPLADPLQSRLSGISDAFVSRLDSAASRLLDSTYLGASGNEVTFATANGPGGSLLVLGATTSPAFPVTRPPGFGGMSDAFLVRLAEGTTQFVPIVLSASGLGGTFFTTELTLTNRGSVDTDVRLTYTAAFGGGSGVVTERLPAGRQKIVPDAVAYLRGLGLPLEPSGSRGGTLAARFLSSEGIVTARTSTRLSNGRAGLAYAGTPQLARLTGTAYVCGLRQDASDRSNLALQNAGGEGDVVLRVTVSSGDTGASVTLPDELLVPGAFRQIGEILKMLGPEVHSGFVRVERVGGSAPFFAYGVINDQVTGDGSFVPPVTDDLEVGAWTLPVAVQTGAFRSEVVVTNFGATSKRIVFTLVADALPAPGSVEATLDVMPGRQTVLPSFVDWLRERGAAIPANASLAGAVFVRLSIGERTGLFIGARTMTTGDGGRFGLFYPAVPEGAENHALAWLFGLRQDAENRTNLALVNAGPVAGGADTFRVELFDGDTGRLAATLDLVTVGPRGWVQIGSVLSRAAPPLTNGYARVTRAAGSSPFLAYAVINDGAAPGQRTGDGAYLSSVP